MAQNVPVRRAAFALRPSRERGWISSLVASFDSSAGRDRPLSSAEAHISFVAVQFSEPHVTEERLPHSRTLKSCGLCAVIEADVHGGPADRLPETMAAHFFYCSHPIDPCYSIAQPGLFSGVEIWRSDFQPRGPKRRARRSSPSPGHRLRTSSPGQRWHLP
jgi:hypothetical protein